MSARRYVARNHPAMPKAPLKGVRLCIDFPDVESMLQFRDTINKLTEEPGTKTVYKQDIFDIQEMPVGNHYYMAPHSDAADDRTELTREIIQLQTTNYEHRKEQ